MKKVLAMLLTLTLLSSTGVMCFGARNVTEVQLDSLRQKISNLDAISRGEYAYYALLDSLEDLVLAAVGVGGYITGMDDELHAMVYDCSYVLNSFLVKKRNADTIFEIGDLLEVCDALERVENIQSDVFQERKTAAPHFLTDLRSQVEELMSQIKNERFNLYFERYKEKIDGWIDSVDDIHDDSGLFDLKKKIEDFESWTYMCFAEQCKKIREISGTSDRNLFDDLLRRKMFSLSCFVELDNLVTEEYARLAEIVDSANIIVYAIEDFLNGIVSREQVVSDVISNLDIISTIADEDWRDELDLCKATMGIYAEYDDDIVDDDDDIIGMDSLTADLESLKDTLSRMKDSF